MDHLYFFSFASKRLRQISTYGFSHVINTSRQGYRLESELERCLWADDKIYDKFSLPLLSPKNLVLSENMPVYGLNAAWTASFDVASFFELADFGGSTFFNFFDSLRAADYERLTLANTSRLNYVNANLGLWLAFEEFEFQQISMDLVSARVRQKRILKKNFDPL